MTKNLVKRQGDGSVAVAERTGIEQLTLTTREISDYDELMRLTNMVNATDAGVLSSFAPVSYTHLTLPTIYSV